MSEQKQKVCLLVDGNVLKQHIRKQNEQHNAQVVKKYLHHMVQEIHSKFPDVEITLHYFGVHATKDVFGPISGQPYADQDVKNHLRNASIPGADFKMAWGRMYYPFEQQWIMKPESYGKSKLTDDDFILNEQPKGVLTQLVDTMAEKAVCHCESCLFVYGDADDMKYALQATNALDMPVHQVLLDGDKPVLTQYVQASNPKLCDRNIFNEVSESLRASWAEGMRLSECMGLLRGAVEDVEGENILMLDIGLVRSYLAKHNMRTSRHNVESILKQIQQTLPEKVSKTIFYHARVSESHRGTVIAPDEAPIEIQLEKNNWTLPNVEFSLGETRQDTNFPEILKKEKWFVSPDVRRQGDFVPNFRQYDVDDRIAFDMALARMNPMIKRVFLLSADGDFAYSVEQANRAGMEVSLVRLNRSVQGLSARLEHAADDKIYVPVDLNELMLRQDELEIVRQKNEAEKRARLRQVQQQKRAHARLEAEDEEEEYANFIPKGSTKEERWKKKCVMHKKEARQSILKSRNQHHQ